MTTDPPETDTRLPTWRDALAEARARDLAAPLTVEAFMRGDPYPPPERDPSNLNDPRLQRWVIAFAWLLVLVIMGTCVAGGLCLTGALQRCDCEESDG